MKLEKDLYVRTDKGFISQVKDFKEHYTKGKRLVTSSSVKEVDENYLSLKGNQCEFIDSIDYSIPPCYPSDEEIEKIKRHIIKASFNVIDVLEVGDFLDNHCITKIENDTCYLNDGWFINADDIENLVTSICTKEQFEQMSYKLGE